MTSGPLDPKVSEALCDDQDVVSIMQHPKMADALQIIKKEPSKYHELIKDDPELAELFKQLGGVVSSLFARRAPEEIPWWDRDAAEEWHPLPREGN